MKIIIILSTLAILSILINMKFGHIIAQSKIGRNLDMTLDGFTKAMIIGAVGIGILNMVPGYMEVEAYDLNQVNYEKSIEEKSEIQNETYDSNQENNKEIKEEDSETYDEVTPETVSEQTMDKPVQKNNSAVAVAPDAAVLAPVIESEPAAQANPFADGIFSGTGQGFKGGITVEVEVVSGVISRVEVVEQRDDQKWFNRANSKIPSSIIEAQSADVDVVSGATYSSMGIIEGAQDAISQSRGE